MDRVCFTDLSKRYGGVDALRGVSLRIGEGELFGIIGPDGAGKTTLLRILASLLVPDGGTAQVCGLDVVRQFREVRRRLGYMPGRFSLYQDLTVEENLRFFARLFGTSVEANYDLIADIYGQLAPFKDRRAGKLSGGMKQKLALCCSLVHRPKVLLLDEPTTGVDAVSRREFWQMLDRITAQGITVVASTPYMDEAARCRRIALMQDGRFLLTDTPQGVAHSFPTPLWAVRADNMHRLLPDVRCLDEVLSAYSFGDSLHVTFRSAAGVALLGKHLAQYEHTGVEIQATPPGVEDVFIHLGNKDNDEG